MSTCAFSILPSDRTTYTGLAGNPTPGSSAFQYPTLGSNHLHAGCSCCC